MAHTLNARRTIVVATTGSLLIGLLVGPLASGFKRRIAAPSLI